YYVCGGLQDNGSWCGPSAVRSTNGILNSDWFRVGGGDGFYTANDWTDWRILYSESQDGATSRLDLGRGTTVSIRPRGPAGRGGQQLPPGAEGVDPAHLAQFGFGPGAANANSVPPPVAGIVWGGTNDGNVQVSRDGGLTWKNVVDKVPGIPKEIHVSRVEASPFDPGGAYVTFDGHRMDDHKPYVFTTKDFGETWT